MTSRRNASKEWFNPDKLEKQAIEPVLPKEFGWTNRRVASQSFQWFPNSRDMLVSARGDLFVVHPDGKFDQITKTDIDEEDPKLSPDGKQVLYRWKSNLYVLDLATKQIKQLTSDGTPTLLNGKLDWVYPEELDLGTAVWWSPDSKQIAYFRFNVQDEFVYPQIDLLGERALSEPERYPQAGTPNAEVRLGVVSPEGGETKWMDLGGTAQTLLARVAWLPDSSQIAVERFNRVQDRLDLLMCDPQSGAVHPILHEESKTWINYGDNLFFLKSRPEFIWTSEQSGFRQIYRYSDKGELLGQLTKGNWVVTAISAIDENKQRVYYMSNESSPLESQLYSVGVDGGARTLVTKEEGSHTVQANADGSYLVDTWSSIKRPPRNSTENRQRRATRHSRACGPERDAGVRSHYSGNPDRHNLGWNGSLRPPLQTCGFPARTQISRDRLRLRRSWSTSCPERLVRHGLGTGLGASRLRCVDARQPRIQ